MTGMVVLTLAGFSSGETWYVVLEGTFCSSGLPAMSLPPGPLPPHCLPLEGTWIPLPKHRCWTGERERECVCVCVSVWAAAVAVSRPGCRRREGGRRGCWQHLEGCGGSCLPQATRFSFGGTFSSGEQPGGRVFACVYVCVLGLHTCSQSLWAPVGRVMSRPSAGHVCPHICVNMCPGRVRSVPACTYTHTHTHTHTHRCCL